MSYQAAKNPRVYRVAATCVAAALASLAALPASGQTYSVASDFSSTTNPNGPWTYGWLDTLGGTFTTYSQAVTYAGSGGNVYAWDDPNRISSDVPGVFYNPNASASAFVAPNNILPGGSAGFHPGANDEISDFRFTAPTAGTYALSFSFEGADTVGTTTDVHIYTAGADLYSALVNGYGASSLETFSGTVALSAGQVVDIGVGFGANNNYYYDLTAVQGTIAAVPEPSTYVLLIAGLAALGWTSRRRGRLSMQAA